MSKDTITLDNFAEWEGAVDGITIVSRLPVEPYVPSDEINVNLRKVARAARIGHLQLLVFSRSTGEQNSVSPDVNSVGDDGSATAAFSVSASKAPRTRSNTAVSGDPLCTKGVGVINVNLGHSDLDEINLRQAKPWATYIDSSFKEGLRDCGENKLLSLKAARTVAFGASLAVSGIMGHHLGESPIGVAESLPGISLAYNIMNRIRGSQQPETTLIPFLPYDRIGLLQLYSRTNKFVDVK